MADTSSGSQQDLPEEELQQDNSTEGGSEATEGLSTKEEQEGLSEKEKKGFQRLIAEKDKKLTAMQQQAEEYNRKLSELQQQERQKKLNEMDEVTKWKTLANENAEKAAKMELKSFVSTHLAKSNLTDNPISELILETPWAIPAVRRKLPSDPTWDETIEVVKAELPSYLESLGKPDTTKATTEASESEDGMDTERSVGQTTQKKTWTRSEVQQYLESAQDPKDFGKRQSVIQQALTDGRIR